MNREPSFLVGSQIPLLPQSNLSLASSNPTFKSFKSHLMPKEQPIGQNQTDQQIPGGQRKSILTEKQQAQLLEMQSKFSKNKYDMKRVSHVQEQMEQMRKSGSLGAAGGFGGIGRISILPQPPINYNFEHFGKTQNDYDIKNAGAGGALISQNRITNILPSFNFGNDYEKNRESIQSENQQFVIKEYAQQKQPDHGPLQEIHEEEEKENYDQDHDITFARESLDNEANKNKIRSFSSPFIKESFGFPSNAIDQIKEFDELLSKVNFFQKTQDYQQLSQHLVQLIQSPQITIDNIEQLSKFAQSKLTQFQTQNQSKSKDQSLSLSSITNSFNNDISKKLQNEIDIQANLDNQMLNAIAHVFNSQLDAKDREKLGQSESLMVNFEDKMQDLVKWTLLGQEAASHCLDLNQAQSSVDEQIKINQEIIKELEEQFKIDQQQIDQLYEYEEKDLEILSRLNLVTISEKQKNTWELQIDVSEIIQKEQDLNFENISMNSDNEVFMIIRARTQTENSKSKSKKQITVYNMIDDKKNFSSEFLEYVNRKLASVKVDIDEGTYEILKILFNRKQIKKQ